MVGHLFELNSLSNLATFLVEAALSSNIVVGKEDVQEECGLEGDEFV
jgi:hypothetical protein